MKTILTTFLALALSLTVSAQAVFVVQGTSGSSAHQTLANAVAAASAGDYIYVPGGTFSVNNLVIDKQLHIIGAGHFPDSTAATGSSIINGNIHFITGSDNSVIQGIYLNNDIMMGNLNSNGNVSNILISRCSMHNLYLSNSHASFNNVGANNILVKDCIIRMYTNVANSQSITFNNCIFAQQIQSITGNVEFNHCVFLFSGMYVFTSCNSATIRNSILMQGDPSWLAWSNLAQPNTFFHCISPAQSFVNSVNVNFYSCYPYGDDTKKLMVNVPENRFDYSYDFHLTGNSAAKGIGAEGVDVGIYGGADPFKEGGVPINPHIQYLNIPSTTDNQGKLNISIKVKAQDN